MDRAGLQILVAVAAKSGENPLRRKGKGSLAMFVSQGLVGPKGFLNTKRPKGKRVYIPVPRLVRLAVTLRAYL